MLSGHTRLGTGDVLRLNKSYVAEMCRLDVPVAAGVGHSPRLARAADALAGPQSRERGLAGSPNTGLEVDVMIECDPIGWVAVEVKLGSLEPAVSSAARSLLRLRDKVEAGAAGEPVKLVVLTGSGSAYETASGVSVVPLTMLGP